MVGRVRIGGRVPRRTTARIGVWSLRFAGLVLAGAGTVLGQRPDSSTTQLPPPRRIPERSLSAKASLQGRVRDEQDRAVSSVALTIRSLSKGSTFEATTDAEGIFRLRDLPLDVYEFRAVREGYEPLVGQRIQISAAGLVVWELKIKGLGTTTAPPKDASGVPGASRIPGGSTPSGSAYPGLRSPASEKPIMIVTAETLPPASANFAPDPDRWDVAMPEWRRYDTQPDVPYVKGHWYDPFNRNKLKGDYPIFGQQWFLNVTARSQTGVDLRRLPLPSGVDTARPGSSGFFGRGEQVFASETLRFSLDLFRGDTSFRPAGLRFRFTPGVNLNFLQARERGIVNIDPRKGTDRFDAHVGVQEAFVEAKLRDLSPNFDFVSIRAGIQQFTSDFRGFLFSEEQPGIRIFGNLRSNRIAYNLAWFYLLEKNTNSGLNTFEKRDQQVYVANVYVQDFLAKGYTTEFSFHYNRDDGGVHFDDNGFLVRPAPIGAVVNGTIRTHPVRAYYLGWASNGHIGRVNVSHAFYQALGHDDFNTLAGRRVDINARMAALELSIDKDWARYRASFFYASGDSSSRSGAARTDGTAHGFDSIVDDMHFAGSDFSFWNREGIRLTGTGVALVTPISLLPDLRSNKEEGQANFVNPGVMVFNLGADFNLTPKLRAFANTSYLRFDRTEPLELVLFQRPIDHGIGTDFGVGVEYRPPLSENIVVRGGASALVPAEGLKQIYNGQTLFSLFGNVRFQF
jgi:Carboxypeptidase regulatory-like domain